MFQDRFDPGLLRLSGASVPSSGQHWLKVIIIGSGGSGLVSLADGTKIQVTGVTDPGHRLVG